MELPFRFVFDIEPYPKRTGRIVRRGKFPHLIKNERTRSFETSINTIARNLYQGEPLDIPLKVTVQFFMTKPDSVRRSLPCVKPDIDNLLKSFLDGCNKIIWADDSLICSLFATKHYSDGAGYICLTVTEML